MSVSRCFRLAIRQWARQPRLAITVVFTLALGTGGATTMYAVLQAIGHSGRPTVPRAQEVARVFTGMPHETAARSAATVNDYRHWLSNARSAEILAAYVDRRRLMISAAGEEEVSALSVTPSLFRLLGLPPARGRYFAEEDVRTSGGQVAVLGERAWRSRFGADPSVLGRSLDVDGRRYTVVGVTPEPLGLVLPGADLYLPFEESEGRAPARVMLRRRADASWDTVRAELRGVGLADRTSPARASVVPILEEAGYRMRAGWLLMVGPALLLLLIGCGNVASLLLVRAVQREKEMATRMALGGSRVQIAAQLLVEGFVIALAGGALGLCLAAAGLAGVQALIPAQFGAFLSLTIDATVLAFSVAATLLTPLVFGTAPLLHSLRLDLTGALKAGLRKPLFGLRQYHARDVFAIVQVGTAVGMALFTFMLVSLFAAAGSIEFGFAGEGLVTAEIRVPHQASFSRASGVALRRGLRERMLAIPGVTSATLGALPYAGQRMRAGRPGSSAETDGNEVRVDASYFEALRLPLRRGRGLNARDEAGSGSVVVSESLAAYLWPGQEAIGQALRTTVDGAIETVTVVGVAEDAVRLGRLASVSASEFVALPRVVYRPWEPGRRPPVSQVVVRVDREPDALLARIREAVRAVDPALRVGTLSRAGSRFDLVASKADRGMRTPMLVLQLGFCALALLLAAVGVFGVMRQLVDERRAELGVRLALGASPTRLVRSVVTDGVVRVGIGAAMGVVVVGVLARLTFTGLVSVSLADPRPWSAVVAAVGVSAAAACWLPARRAAGVDPIEVLRCE